MNQDTVYANLQNLINRFISMGKIDEINIVTNFPNNYYNFDNYNIVELAVNIENKPVLEFTEDHSKIKFIVFKKMSAFIHVSKNKDLSEINWEYVNNNKDQIFAVSENKNIPFDKNSYEHLSIALHLLKNTNSDQLKKLLDKYDIIVKKLIVISELKLLKYKKDILSKTAPEKKIYNLRNNKKIRTNRIKKNIDL